MKRIEYAKIAESCNEVVKQCKAMPTIKGNKESWATGLYEKVIACFTGEPLVDSKLIPAEFIEIGKGSIDMWRDGHYVIYFNVEEELTDDDC